MSDLKQNTMQELYQLLDMIFTHSASEKINVNESANSVTKEVGVSNGRKEQGI